MPSDGAHAGVTRVLIADDHPATVLGLSTLIAGYGAPWDVCGTATNAAEAVGKAMELRPDIVMMEHALPRRLG